MAYGDKYCEICEDYLGNYITGPGNTFSIRALKYCPKCKPMILNQQKSFSHHNRKTTYKMQNHELLAQNTLLKQQNELLREENRILKAEVRAMYND